MSRAFMKERDDAPEPAAVSVAHARPKPMTPAGFQALERRVSDAREPGERALLRERLGGAFTVNPPEDRTVVAFGAHVVVSGAARTPQTFQIVGEDESDVRAGRVSVSSPLARALLGQRAGATVTWKRPAGDLELTIRSIGY